MSYAKGKIFNLVFLPLRYSAGDTYRGSGLVLDKFMSFDCFLSSVDCNYFICGDFNIHVDVPCTDSHKLKALLESCNLRQSVQLV